MKKIVTVLALVMTLALAGGAFAAEDKIGYIDPRIVLNAHPKYAAAQKQIDEFTKKKADAARTATQKEKDPVKAAEIINNARKESGAEEVRLMNPITVDINKAIEKAAKAKGITVVINKGLVFVGGTDLTDDVAKILKNTK